MSNTLLTYFIMGSLGVLLQIFAVKVPTLAARFKTANRAFSFIEYLKGDWYTIIASFVTVGIVTFGIDEILDAKPELEKYIKWFFLFVGYTGSSIIQNLLSVANRKIMAIIDVKTNIADGVQPPVTKENIEGAKEIAKEDNLTGMTPAAPLDAEIQNQSK